MFSLTCAPVVVVVKLFVVFPVPLGVEGTLPALLEKFPELVHRYGDAWVPLPVQLAQLPVAPLPMVSVQANGGVAKPGLLQGTVAPDDIVLLLAVDTVFRVAVPVMPPPYENAVQI